MQNSRLANGIVHERRARVQRVRVMRVPNDSPLRRNAEIQLGLNYDTIDRTDEARKHLEKLIAANPGDIDGIMALGNILRGRKVFGECADAYTKGIDTLKNPEKANWLIFYFRGICFERSKQWAKAEADLKKALELYPDQAHVLNYLGYSWIDQGINLDDGMRMIKRAASILAEASATLIWVLCRSPSLARL